MRSLRTGSQPAGRKCQILREGDFQTLAFTPKGKCLAVSFCYGEPAVKVWDVLDNRLLLSQTGKEAQAVAFSADSSRLAIAVQRRPVEVWDVARLLAK